MLARSARCIAIAVAVLSGCSGGDSVQPGPTTRTVTVTTSGTGTGTVTSSPSGITCGSTCSASLSTTAAITLTAASGVNSQFVGWSGACSGASATCTVPAGSGAVSATAQFNLVVHSLTVVLSGTGTGTVTSSPAGINCGSDCTEAITAGTTVTLTATPSTSSTFTGWSGGGCTGTGACSVTMNAATTVSATFTIITNPLTVALAGTGAGTVTSSPAGISCGADCTEAYNIGTAVTLTAAPNASSVFAGWSGGGCTGTGTCVVTMNAAASVTATFTLATRALTVTLSGTGTGTVTSAPAGITCGADCTESYNTGTVVTLTAAPAASSTFAGWSGGACSGTGTCVVTMNAATTVTATFTLVTNTLTVTRAGAGGGTVTSAPAGINCGADCTEAYNFGTLVTLTAVADATSAFGGWTGAGCAGTGTCAVTMNQTTAVTALFNIFEPRWPDSGTRFCIDGAAAIACPGGPVGQDGFYQINVPAYLVLGGRVQDPVTGFIWERNPPITGLTHAAAITYCNDLSLDGFDDWRLPSYLELISIADFGATVPGFTVSAFPGIPQNSNYWTSTDRATSSTQAFAMNTNYPTTTYSTKSDAAGRIVRCVRGTPLTGALTVAGGSVTDNRTKLVWQSATAGVDMTWLNALAYCEALVLDGNSDWRLPNGKELLSIVDPTQTTITISPLFAVRPDTRFWSSSVVRTGPATAYAVRFDSGISADIGTAITENRSVRCVR